VPDGVTYLAQTRHMGPARHSRCQLSLYLRIDLRRYWFSLSFGASEIVGALDEVGSLRLWRRHSKAKSCCLSQSSSEIDRSCGSLAMPQSAL
jgi:hypothetical protein